MSSFSIEVRALGKPVASAGHYDPDDAAQDVISNADAIANDMILRQRSDTLPGGTLTQQSALDALLARPGPLDRFRD